MPDLTMCAATCPASRTCRRHEDSGTVVTWPEHQSWADFRPAQDASGSGCGDYLPRRDEDALP